MSSILSHDAIEEKILTLIVTMKHYIQYLRNTFLLSEAHFYFLINFFAALCNLV